MYKLNRQKILKTFFDLVKIYSPSGKEEKVAEYIINYLKNIKIKAEKDSFGNVTAKVPGKGKPIMLCAHMDSVEPCKNIIPVVKKEIITSKGNTILGADDKAGIAEILVALKYLYENNIKKRNIELIFTTQEEIGTLGALNLDYKKIVSKEGLVLDAGQPIGTIIIAAPYIALINIKVKGLSCHSKCPEKGVNAITIASKAIAGLKIGKINSSTTNNIGVIKGGKSFNIIPDEVNIEAEVRSHKKQYLEIELNKIKKSFQKYAMQYNGKVNFNIEYACDGYLYSKNDTFIKEIAYVNKVFEKKSEYQVYFAGSDANAFAKNNIKAITIAYGAKNAHSVNESLEIKDYEFVIKFLINFLQIK